MKQFKKTLLFLLTLALLPAMQVFAQQIPQLPIDPAVRMGVLPNGMTYYIRHNNLPEKQAFFYIVQKVGSVQEEESQRGLAHFLEHMAFGGTTNFPGNGIINYTQRIGVKFGENLNAYTSTDETVYNIDNVPVTPANLDSCLLILHDWSHDLLLTPEEIKKQRGIIHEEWRLRSSASQRILNRNLEKLYPGSRYGKRMPIGLMSVVDNFKPEELKAYYRKWYRPDLQGIVVVGDFDAAQMEAKVKKLFSDLPNPKNEAKYESYPVPDNNEPIYVIDKDKEQTVGVMEIMFKTEPMDRNMRGSQYFLMQNYFTALATSALNQRFSEMTQKPDCPFVQAGVDYGTYLLSKTCDALSVYIVPKPGKDAEAVKAVMAEIKRANKFGITETELMRADDEFLSNLEAVYNNRDKQKSSYYIPQYYRHFLEGNAIPSIETEYNLYKMISQQLRSSKQLSPVVSQMVAELTARTDTNFVFLAMYPEKDGVVVPTEAQMKAAVAAGMAENVTAYVDNVKNEPLITKLPKAGSVKKQEAADFGYTKWTLSNGAVVYFKKTDFNESQIIMSAQSAGGLNELNIKDPKTLVNAQMAADIVDGTGLGNFKQTELEKALAGKQVSLSSSINNDTESLGGSSTPKDLRTLFEMLYLKFTAIGNDPESYNNTLLSMKTQLENAEKVPETAFSDSIRTTIYGHDARLRTTEQKKADFALYDYQTMQKIYRERFNSPSDFTFFFTGNINVDSLKQFCELYLASIPAAKNKEVRRDPKLELVNGQVTNKFVRSMETPKANIVILYHGNHPYSLKEAQIINAFGSVLDDRVLQSVREKASIAYSTQAGANASYGFHPQYSVQLYCPVKPANVDQALQLMNEAIKEIAEKGVTAEELDKVKKFEIKEYQESQKNNGYWQGLISAKTFWNQDGRTGYEAAVNGVTSQDIQNFAKNVLLKQNNKCTIIMMPESLHETE